MVILIPLALFFLTLGTKRRSFFPGWREAVLFALIVASSLAVLAVEVLSPFKLLTEQNIFFFWIVLTMLALYWAWTSPHEAAGIDWKNISRNIDVPQIIVLAIAGGTFLVALNVAPNSFDSMVYHLPRVLHWLQEGTVASFPTDIVCQNWPLPGAQYWLLHVYALTGNDHFVNLVQWGSFIGVAVVVSLLAEYLGAGKLGRAVAAVAAMTIPTGLLQSTTSQSDLVFSFWIITAVFFWVRSMSRGRWLEVVCGGLAYGLALLTKGTAVYFLPFLAWLAIQAWQAGGFRGLLRPLVIIVISGCFLAGWGMRYAQDRGREQAEQGASIYYLGDYSWAHMLSNASKHVLSECNVPLAPLRDSSRQAIILFNKGLGFELNDEATTTFSVAWDEFHPLSSLHEDHAGNLIQIAFLALACLAALFWRRPQVTWYLACLGVASVLFLLTLRWGPTINRFHLPFILMAVPVMAGLWDRSRWRSAVFALCLLILVLPSFFSNPARPIEWDPRHNVLLLPRNLQYFANRRFWPSYIKGHAAVARYMQERGCRVVGLTSSLWSWEFPLWALTPKPARFCSVSADLGQAEGNAGCKPCMVVVLQKELPAEIVVGGRKFFRAEEFKAMQIFLPSGE